MSTPNLARPTTFRKEVPGNQFPLSSVATGAPPVFPDTQQLAASFSQTFQVAVPLFSAAGFQTISIPITLTGFPAINLNDAQAAALHYGANVAGAPPAGLIITPTLQVNYASSAGVPPGAQVQMLNGGNSSGQFGVPSLTLTLSVYATAAAAAASVPVNVWAILAGSVKQA